MIKEPNFAFGKTIGINQSLAGDLSSIHLAIERLFACMKQTNKLHEVECEFFRLDFRQPYFDEQMQFPLGCLILDLKWGSKSELEKKDKNGKSLDEEGRDG